MFIKAVNKNLMGKNGTQYVIGKEYNDVHFCDGAFATGEYYENPTQCRYLEVQPYENNNLGDGCSFKGRVKIIREIPIKELLDKDLRFKSRYDYYKNLKRN